MELKVRALNQEKRECKQCGAQFIPIVGNQKFCTNECRDTWYTRFPQRYYELRPTKEKVCPQCKKMFLSNNRRKKYCSPECQVEHREHAYAPKAQVERVCARCGQHFETSHASKKYCSEECRLGN